MKMEWRSMIENNIKSKLLRVLLFVSLSFFCGVILINFCELVSRCYWNYISTISIALISIAFILITLCKKQPYARFAVKCIVYVLSYLGISAFIKYTDTKGLSRLSILSTAFLLSICYLIFCYKKQENE